MVTKGKTSLVPTPKANPPASSYDEAVKRMVDRDFFRSTRWDEQQFRADLGGASPEILLFLSAFQYKLKKMGIPMFAHAVTRGKAAQTQAYVQGNSRAQYGQSPHNYGMAVDLIHSQHAWALSEKQWEIIGVLGKEVALQRGIRINWGGNDGPGDRFSWDPAHWEISDWKQQKEFFPWIPTQIKQRTQSSPPTQADLDRMAAWELWKSSMRTRRQ